MKNKIIRIFSILLVFLIFGCGNATRQENNVIKYKVKIIQPKDGSIVAEPLIDDEEVEKDSIIIFTVKADNPILQKVKTWEIEGGKLLEGGEKGDEKAKIQISRNVTVGVQFENIAYIEYNSERFKGTAMMNNAPLNSGDKILFGSKIVFSAKCDDDKIVKGWQINKNKAPDSEFMEIFEYTPKHTDAIEKDGKMIINIDFEQKIPSTYSLTFDATKVIAGTLNPMAPLASPANVKEGSKLVFWALVPGGKAVSSWKTNNETLPNSEKVIYFCYMNKDMSLDYVEKEAKKAKMVYDNKKIWCSFSRPNPPGAPAVPVPKENTLYEGDLLVIHKNGGGKCKFTINGMNPAKDDLIPPEDDVFLLSAGYFKNDGILNLEIKE